MIGFTILGILVFSLIVLGAVYIVLGCLVDHYTKDNIRLLCERINKLENKKR